MTPQCAGGRRYDILPHGYVVAGGGRGGAGCRSVTTMGSPSACSNCMADRTPEHPLRMPRSAHHTAATAVPGVGPVARTAIGQSYHCLTGTPAVSTRRLQAPHLPDASRSHHAAPERPRASAGCFSCFCMDVSGAASLKYEAFWPSVSGQPCQR